MQYKRLAVPIMMLSLAGANPAAAAACPGGFACVTDVPVVQSFGPNCLDFTMKGNLYSLPYDHFSAASAVLIGSDIKDHALTKSPLTVVFTGGQNNEPCGYPTSTFPTSINGVLE